MPGAERLRDCAVLTELVAKQREAGKLHAAICATPAVAFEPQGEAPLPTAPAGWCGGLRRAAGGSVQLASAKYTASAA